MISLLKRMLSLIRPNVLLMRSSLCLRLNFQLLLRLNLMTSGNWLQHCSRSPVSWIHYHLPLSNNVQTYCCLPLLREGCMPTCLKSAVLSPLLKGPDADFLQFKNVRPISRYRRRYRRLLRRVLLFS